MKKNIEKRFTFSLPLYREPDERLANLIKDDEREFALTVQYREMKSNKDPDRLYFYPNNFCGVFLTEEERLGRLYAPLPKDRYAENQVQHFATLFNSSSNIAHHRVITLQKPTAEQNKGGIQKILQVEFFNLEPQEKMYLATLFELLAL